MSGSSISPSQLRWKYCVELGEKERDELLPSLYIWVRSNDCKPVFRCIIIDLHLWCIHIYVENTVRWRIWPHMRSINKTCGRYVLDEIKKINKQKERKKMERLNLFRRLCWTSCSRFSCPFMFTKPPCFPRLLCTYVRLRLSAVWGFQRVFTVVW